MPSNQVENNLIKDLGEIHGRLFDHRPFLQGEINLFVKEFEEKRNDKEVTQLFEMLETLTEIKESQIDKAARTGEAHLSNVTTNLEVALRMCNKIVERGVLENFDDLLAARRESRKQEWNNFLSDMAEKNVKVDKMFTEKEDELRNYYTDLEEKLHISPKHSATSTSASVSSNKTN